MWPGIFSNMEVFQPTVYFRVDLDPTFATGFPSQRQPPVTWPVCLFILGLRVTQIWMETGKAPFVSPLFLGVARRQTYLIISPSFFRAPLAEVISEYHEGPGKLVRLRGERCQGCADCGGWRGSIRCRATDALLAIEIVDLPIKNWDFPVRYVGLLEVRSYTSTAVPLVDCFTCGQSPPFPGGFVYGASEHVSGLTRFLKQQGQLVSTTGGSTLMTALSHALLYLSFPLRQDSFDSLVGQGRAVLEIWWCQLDLFRPHQGYSGCMDILEPSKANQT